MTDSLDNYEMEAIRKEMAEMQAMINELNTNLEPLESAKKQAQADEYAARQAYEAAIAKSREVRKSLDLQSYNFQSKLNQVQSDLRFKERELRAKEAKEKQDRERKEREAEMLLLNAKWDRLTMGAAWREWAKDHQINAGHFLTENRNVILADPMGLGKTLSAIISVDMAEAATRLTNDEFPFLGEAKEVGIENSEGEWGVETKIINGITRPVGKRILYFCPSSLIRNVKKEFEMWAAHRNVTYMGGMTKAERGFIFDFVLKDRADFVVICNYEAWRKDSELIEKLINLDPDTVILDEAHMIKDQKTIGYRGIRRLLDGAQPEYVIPMTGTPILNRPQELYSLLTLVNPKEFYHLNDFLFNFCEQTQEGFWKFQPGGLERIASRISKNFMRRTKAQAGIVLPEQTIINHDLEVDEEAYPEQANVRLQMRKYATIVISEDKAIAAAAMIAVFTRLRQIETWPAGIQMRDPITKEITTQVDVKESQKLDYVISSCPDNEGNYTGLIPDAIEDERMVLFSQFKEPLRELKKRIDNMGYRAVIIDGDTSITDRESIGNDFDPRYTPNRDDSKFDIALCNYRVGGVGINLTAATQMIILDEEWNPGKRDQAYARIDRMGQTNETTVHVIRNQNTIDDWLANIMQNKESMVDGFNNTMVSVSDFKEALDSGLI